MLYPFGKNRVPYIDVLKRANFSKTGNLDLAEEKRRKEEVQPENIYNNGEVEGKEGGEMGNFSLFHSPPGNNHQNCEECWVWNFEKENKAFP